MRLHRKQTAVIRDLGGHKVKLTNTTVKVISLSILLGCITVGFQNCSPEKFTAIQPTDDSSNNPNNSASCTQTLITTSENLRIIFMVDNSDSTAGKNGTDPNKVYRVQVLNNFLSMYGTKTNFNYSFGWFAPLAYNWDVSQSAFEANPKQAVGTATDLSNALNAFEPLSSQNGTAYKAAFAGIQNVIDGSSMPNDGWNYAVVFMSDGMPTDLGSASGQAAAIQQLVANLQTDVTNHGALVSVSSVYFGPESDGTSINNLKTMAITGGGQFVDTNLVQTLNISDVITIPGNTCAN